MPIKCPVAPLEFGLADWHLRGAESAAAPSSSTRHRSTAPSRSRSPRSIWRAARREADRAGDRVQRRRGRRHRPQAQLLRRARARLRPARDDPAARRRPMRRTLPGLGDALGFVPTDKRTLQTPVKPNVFALGDATDLPTSRPAPSPTSKPRSSPRTSPATSPTKSSTPATTGTPTASSRPASTKPCSSTSTTRPSRCLATSPPRSDCCCCASSGSTTSASSRSSGSTGTRSCPDARSPASDPRCQPPARSTPQFTPERRTR